MLEYDPEHESRIKEQIDREFGGPSEYLEDPQFLTGNWQSAFPNGQSVFWSFEPTGICQRWIEGTDPADVPLDRWKLVGDGWLSKSRQHKGIWYEDLWRIYVFDKDRFVLANDDASVKLEHRRVTDPGG